MDRARRLPPILCFLLLLPATVSAQVGVEYYSYDAVFGIVLSDTVFVAQGRLGDLAGLSTYEVGLGPGPDTPDKTGQLAWGSWIWEDFALSYDVLTGLVLFRLGGVVLIYATAFPEFDAIFVRGYARQADTRVYVKDMYVDGFRVPGYLDRSGPDGLAILQIFGPVLRDGFTLTGRAKFIWEGEPPGPSDLSFQFWVLKMAVVGDDDLTWGAVKNLYR